MFYTSGMIKVIDEVHGKQTELEDGVALLVEAIAELSSRLPKPPYRMEVHVGERDVKLIPQPTYIFKEP